ncbi:MAG: two-component sensor histidine kinase, partial [Thermoleophilia bacterium]
SQVGREIATRAPADIELWGDRARLDQALGALVDNAFRHGRGEVRIEAVANGRRVELHVLDQGPGFPPPFLERAFERFSRAAPSGCTSTTAVAASGFRERLHP